MKVKKIIGLVLVVALLLVLTVGCAPKSEEAAASTESVASTVEESANAVETSAEESGTNEKIVIGCTLQDLSNEYIAMMKDAMVYRVANKYPDVELQVLDAEGDAQKQIQQMDTFIASGVNSIAICPRDANQLIPSTENAIAAGIPVVTVGALLEKDVGQAVVTSVNDVGGEMLMNWVAEKLGNKGNIAIMRGPIGASAEIQRFEGFQRVLDANPDMKVVFDQTANWSREEGTTLMENWIQSGTEINALVAQNDEMALGALQAIEAAGLKDKIIVVGMDGIPDAFNSIKEGKLDCTCFQSAIGQGFGGVDMAVAIAKGEKPTLVDVGWKLVLPENVDEMFAQISLDTYKE
jgi:inositol transport system substrate-binding protein